MRFLLSLLIVLPLFGQGYQGIFVPLQKGNFWKFNIVTYNQKNKSNGMLTYFKDIDDEYVIDNNKYHHIIFANTGQDLCFCRVNEEGYYVYRFKNDSGYSKERKYYKKDMKPGDTLSIAPGEPIKTMVHGGVEDVFGKTIYVHTFQETGSAGPAFADYTDEFGLVYYEDNGYFRQQFFSVGCLVNGSVYGDTSMPTGITTELTKSNSFVLQQNYPNPFNPATTISYTLAQAGLVQLRVYDILGRDITTLVNEIQTAGEHTATFNANELPSGMYICRLQAGNNVQMRKMTLLK